MLNKLKFDINNNIRKEYKIKIIRNFIVHIKELKLS